MSRRFQILLVITAASLFFAGSAFFRRDWVLTYSSPPAPPPAITPPDASSGLAKTGASPSGEKSTVPPENITPPVQESAVKKKRPGKVNIYSQVAIFQATEGHDDVLAALVHAFGSQEKVNISLYHSHAQYGIDKVMNAFKLPGGVPTTQHPVTFIENRDDQQHDVVYIVSGEMDLLEVMPRLQDLLADSKTHLFCGVHHADKWAKDSELEKALRPWVAAERVDFITLSLHTAKYFQENAIKKWGIKKSPPPPIRYFAPVFPVKLTPLAHISQDDEAEWPFAIQGHYESKALDWETVFGHLEKFIDQRIKSGDYEMPGKKGNVSLHLLGDGERPEVPEAVEDRVFFDQGLSYLKFYTQMSTSFAVLPAFASDDHHDRQASSSIPNALIGGSPLVATKQILDAYGYLPKDATYVQAPEETEFDVIARVVFGSSAAERTQKMWMVRSRCLEIIKDNVKFFGEWIEEVERRRDGKKIAKDGRIQAQTLIDPVDKAADKKPFDSKTQDQKKLDDKKLESKKDSDEKSKSSDKKPDEKGGDGKKPDEKKGEDQKPDAEKGEDKKPDEKKGEDKKADEKKTDQKKPDAKTALKKKGAKKGTRTKSYQSRPDSKSVGTRKDDLKRAEEKKAADQKAEQKKAAEEEEEKKKTKSKEEKSDEKKPEEKKSDERKPDGKKEEENKKDKRRVRAS